MPAEIRPLAYAFNGVLQRLERSFQEQERFIANAAHELKSWLALARARVEAGLDGEDLVEHALDFSLSGSDVKVLLDVNGLIVEDHGPGVPADHRVQVFERFWRAPGQAGPGSGLGLALVREIAQAHGWTVGCGEAPCGVASFAVRWAP